MASEPSTSAPDPRRSEAVENYSKAIFALQQRAGGSAVSTNALADRLGVTPGSVSAMVKKMADLGLAEHRPYYGVVLTSDGERLALEVLRHHRLLETYLAEHLGVPWDRVHDEAERLEHVISEELEALIAKKLGNPTHDPHGDPIPSAELVLDHDETVSLDDLATGIPGCFVRVSDADPELLRYLDGLGITLGATLEVLGREPFGGPLRVKAGTGEHLLGVPAAQAMRIAVG